MNTIRKYISVSAGTLAELDEKVNKKIGEGYQPFGSPFHKQIPNPAAQRTEEVTSFFVQAMVIY